MDSNQVPVKTEGSTPEHPSIKAEPHDGPLGVAGLFLQPPQSHASPIPRGATHQVGAETSSSERATIKPDPEVKQDEVPKPELEDAVSYLEQLVTLNDLEKLESGVNIGVTLLKKLNDVMSIFTHPDLDVWAKTAQEIMERAKPTRTVVGVVGNTGAGKSSVINALLDEERLLPTNCLRACTASPTEISYNYSDDPAELYRAEIEFITKEEWVNELKVLFDDLLDGNGGISRECTNADSEAGVAYAKLKAVYPQKTREMIAQGSPEAFANEVFVGGVLGSVKMLKDVTAKGLYNHLQRYVDSKEKITGADHKKRSTSMEYWPLIKVVRIYTKADPLSTGAVIVDLPGVQDSNAARAAVAANYMKSCTGLWIVAPITRAVDDKTAKTLLGDTFKRQLKYDGTYSAVSFICSKTDDISVTEAADSLNLEDEVSESWDRAEELRNSVKESKSTIAELKDRKAECIDRVDDLDAQYDTWEDLLTQAAKGKTIYPPSLNPQKRKRHQKPHGSRKRRDMSRSDVDDEWDSPEPDSSDKENSQSDETRKPLTEDEIEEKLASLKSQMKEMRTERRALDGQISDVRKEIQTREAERKEILAEIKLHCIQGRNNYSRDAIKQDFALGIKELDQENAVEEDGSTFDPEQDFRDYDEVARSLPVFCVSSRAYQKLTGRLEKDDFKSDGFISLEDTEVPQLQEHAKKLTEAGRASHCRRFLNDLSQLTNSMKLWVASDANQTPLTDTEKRREEMHLRKVLIELEEGFQMSVREAVNLLEESLEEHVYRIFDSSIPRAVDAALPTANGWGAPRALGGMFWATYKATVRRAGVFAGASGPHDFNQELFDPISRDLATGWERAFQRRLPAVLDQFAVNTQRQLRAFHVAAEARARKRLTNMAGITTLARQIQVHIRTLQELPGALRTTITDLQREASREFTPAICGAMMYAYQTCANENGTGSYNRMKLAMANHVENSRHTMFQEAIDTVKAQLDVMCHAVELQMSDRTETIFDAVFSDYTNVLVGRRVDRHVKLSSEELAMRADVNDVLECGNSMFAPLLGVPDAEDPEKMDGVIKAEAPNDGAGTARVEDTDEDTDHASALAEADEFMQQQIHAQSQASESESDP
ncbi:hypothetical protein AAE478_001160 [Parahypoxylon ruwenzoriense]